MDQNKLDKALLEAADKGDVEALKAAIAAGANVNTEDRKTALCSVLCCYDYRGRGIRLLSDEYNECAKVLINAGADVSVHDPRGKAPLHYAAEYASLEVVEAILNAGGDVNVETMDGRTPLFFAARREDADVAKLLLARGANVLHENSWGETSLHDVSDAVAPLLLNAGADVNTLSIWGITPLFMAVEHCQSKTAKLLLDAGAEINLFDYLREKTPLLSACYGGCSDCIKLLLDAGADVNVTDSCGHSALYRACYAGGDLDCIKLLMEAGSDDVNAGAPIIGAAWCEKFDIVFYLIDKGADINAKTEEGFTVLGVAILKGQTETAKLLLAAGAQVDDWFYDDYTGKNYSVLRGAAEFCDLELVKHLVELGADVHAVDDEGLTPLHCYEAKKECVQYFVEECGLDVNARDAEGATPLIYAAYESDLDCLRYLIDIGADINVADAEGWTALGSALDGNAKEAVELLLQKGADVNVSWKNGETPLLYAVKNKGTEIVKLLIDAGADVYASDAEGATPLYVACSKNKLDVERIRVLVENGVDVNRPFNAEGEAPLLYAFKKNNEALVELLSNLGADLNAVSTDLNHMLFNIVSKGCRDSGEYMRFLMGELDAQIRLLYKYGADVNYYPANEDALLCLAVRNEKLGIAKLLLELGASVAATALSGKSILSASNKEEIINLLLKEVACSEALRRSIEKKTDDELIDDDFDDDWFDDDLEDVCFFECQNTNTSESLNDSCCSGAFSHPCITSKLLQDFFPDDSNLQTAFSNLVELAQKNTGYVTDDDIFNSLPTELSDSQAELVFERLLAIGVEVRDEGIDYLLDAIDSGNLDAVERRCVAAGVNVNRKDKDGYTPLYHAIRKGDSTIVQKLLDAGADVNAVFDKTATPLMIAVRDNNLEMVKLLLLNGADVNAKDKGGYNSLFGAAMNGNYEIAKLLIDAGGDVNAAGVNKVTPLFAAVRYKNIEICKLYISAGADVNAADYERVTCVHMAAAFEQSDILRILIDSGADVNAVDTVEGNTPLHVAAGANRRENVHLLLEAGADVKARNEDGDFADNLTEDKEIRRMLIKAGTYR